MSLLNEIEILASDLKSEKVAPRQKAFNRLHEILNRHCNSELEKLFDDSQISWTILFSAAHTGVLINSLKLNSTGKEVNENDTRVTSHSKLLLKICDSPSEGEINRNLMLRSITFLLFLEFYAVQYTVLMKSVYDVLQDEVYFKYYGISYLKILQNVLKPKNNLTSITLDSWKGRSYSKSFNLLKFIVF